MKKFKTLCLFCDKELFRYYESDVHFCNTSCKAQWQRTQKPVDKDWLYQKYIVERLDCNKIAKIVNRNSKRVWEWIKDYDIPTRPRGFHAHGKGFQKGHLLSRGRKLSSEHKEAIRQARLKDKRIPAIINGKHWLHVYTNRIHPSWKGGITPDRQTLYNSKEWGKLANQVWRRDNAKCQRCGLDARNFPHNNRPFHIHHIDSFMIKERRTDVNNLVLLCERCHRWVHGKSNSKREFLGKGH